MKLYHGTSKEKSKKIITSGVINSLRFPTIENDKLKSINGSYWGTIEQAKEYGEVVFEIDTRDYEYEIVESNICETYYVIKGDITKFSLYFK